MNATTLRQLRYVETLDRTNHFGRAADLCAVSQPALSTAVAALEAEFGLPLFERSTRGVRPTPFGARVAERARAILRGVDDLHALALAERGALRGRIGLGIIPTVAPYLLPTLAGLLAGRHPDVELRVRESVTATLVAEVTDGRLDAAILALPLGRAGLVERPLLAEPFVLVRPAADAARPVPDAAGLRAERLLLLEEGHCFRDQALAYCDGASDAGLEGSSLTTLVQMVAAGMGVTLIPRMAVATETARADVAVSPFADPVPSRRLALVWRRSNPLADRLAELADTVEAAAHAVAAT